MKPNVPPAPVVSPRLAAAFERAQQEQRAALITYIMAGDPDLETSKLMASACIEGGADIIELGVPFSDPIADGPINQQASQRALASGTNLKEVLKLAGQLREQWPHIPIALMGYLNPILAMGEWQFFANCARLGVDASIVPDLLPEEATEFRALAAEQGIATVFLVATTSKTERQAAACAASTGFIYLVSVSGVTGVRGELPQNLPARITELKSRSAVPVAIGFGISQPEQAATLGEVADAVIVGSAIVSKIAADDSVEERAQEVRKLVSSLRKAIGLRRSA